MTSTPDRASASLRLLAIAGLAAGAMALTSGLAQAGSCPADKVGGNQMTAMPDKPKGVSDTVLTHIDLAKEKVMAEGRMFRLRRLEVKPGGIVPFHSHADRPALIYIVKGTITEYSTGCLVPIVHKAGEAAMESVGLAHWWKNTSKGTVVLISADILHTEKQADPTM